MRADLFLPLVALSLLQLAAATPIQGLGDQYLEGRQAVAPADSYDDGNHAVMQPPDPAPANDTFVDADTNPEPDVDAAQKPSSSRGITYSPYTNTMACKSQAAIHADLKRFNAFDTVRIYGTDCNQAMTVSKAAKALKLKVMAGIFNLDGVEDEAHMVLKAIKAHHVISAVSVGNEIVQNGGSSAQVVAAIKKVRQILRNGGFKGPVVTVDTVGAILAHPELCHASDFAAANIQPYFDGHVAAGGAGKFVRSQHNMVQNKCKKKTVVTEAGWPSKGNTNGAAVPSPANQKKAIASIKNEFKDNIFLFTAYNDFWKPPGGYGVEQSFGILN